MLRMLSRDPMIDLIMHISAELIRRDAVFFLLINQRFNPAHAATPVMVRQQPFPTPAIRRPQSPPTAVRRPQSRPTQPATTQQIKFENLTSAHFADSQVALLKDKKYHDFFSADTEELDDNKMYSLVPTKLPNGKVVFHIFLKEEEGLGLDHYKRINGFTTTFKHPIDNGQIVDSNQVIHITGGQLKAKIAELWPNQELKASPVTPVVQPVSTPTPTYTTYTEDQIIQMLINKHDELALQMRQNPIVGKELFKKLGQETNFANSGMTVLQLLSTVYDPAKEPKLMSLANIMRSVGVDFNLVGQGNAESPVAYRQRANHVVYNQDTQELEDPFLKFLQQPATAQPTPRVHGRAPAIFTPPPAPPLSREKEIFNRIGLESAIFQGDSIVLRDGSQFNLLHSKLKTSLGPNIFQELNIRIERGLESGNITLTLSPTAKEILLDALDSGNPFRPQRR